jgi:hypothetical protein
LDFYGFSPFLSKNWPFNLHRNLRCLDNCYLLATNITVIKGSSRIIRKIGHLPLCCVNRVFCLLESSSAQLMRKVTARSCYRLLEPC